MICYGFVPVYRPARPAPAFWNILKTIPALLVTGLLVVGLIPRFIASWQLGGEFDALIFPGHHPLGIAFGAGGTLLVAWSGLTLAITGNGTPMPFDAPRRLVMVGPYSWFRNPMVTGTVAQGVGAGVYLGSGLVIICFLLCALLWDVLVRHDDEDRLQKSFGREFEAYRRNVRCWLPMRRSWAPPPRTGPISLDELPDPPRPRRRQ